jgi:ribosomal protein S27AE
MILKDGENVELQRERTKKSVCARCGLVFGTHTKRGQCSDGGGYYTWAREPEPTTETPTPG